MGDTNEPTWYVDAALAPVDSPPVVEARHCSFEVCVPGGFGGQPAMKSFDIFCS